MRTPRKIFLVVSRRFVGDVEGQDMYVKRGEAEAEAARRNKEGGPGDPTDWRVVPFNVDSSPRSK